MKVSRGAFLKICGAAALGTGVPTWASAGVPAARSGVGLAGISSGPFRMEDARAALFRPHLNTAFVLRPAGGAAVPLVLRSVTEPPVHNRVEQFSLMFHAPAGLAVTDGIHALRHATLGDFDLFIVQVGGSTGRRVAYEACFSRHVSATEGPCPRRS